MKRLLPFIIPFILLIGLIVGVTMLLHPDGRRSELAEYLSKRLGHTVQIGKLDASLFPPTLLIKDVTLFQKPGNPLLQVEQIDAVIGWANLLSGKKLPVQLGFQNWKLSTHRRANGSWDWDEWLGVGAQGSVIDAWPVKKVTSRQGEWHWVDDQVSREVVLKEIEGIYQRESHTITASGNVSAASPVTLTFEGKGPFFANQPWSGDLRLADEGRQWIVHFNGQSGRVETQGQSTEWRLDHAYNWASFYLRWPMPALEPASLVLLHDWKTQFIWTPIHTVFSHTALLSGGQTEIKGDISSGPQNQILALKMAVQDVPLDSLSPMTGHLNMDGKITGIATDFSVPLTTNPLAALNGRGSVELKDGHIRIPATTTKALSKAHTMAYMRAKFPDFETQGLPLARARAHWVVTNGFFSTDDGILVGTDLTVALVGKLDVIRRGMDAYISLHLKEKSSDLLKLISGKYLYGAPGHEQIMPIFGRVQGSWNEWSVRATPSGKVPAAAKAHLRRAR